MHFDFKQLKVKNVSIESFDMEEMTGRDNMDAAARVVPRRDSDGKMPQISAFEMNIRHRNQLIAQSISKVDGEMVPRPYTGWELWSMRTQEFVVAAYNKMNDAGSEEVSDFLQAHFDATPEDQAEPDSSRSGSGSVGT